MPGLSCGMASSQCASAVFHAPSASYRAEVLQTVTSNDPPLCLATRRETHLCFVCNQRRPFRILQDDVLECTICGAWIKAFGDEPPEPLFDRSWRAGVHSSTGPSCSPSAAPSAAALPVPRWTNHTANRAVDPPTAQAPLAQTLRPRLIPLTAPPPTRLANVRVAPPPPVDVLAPDLPAARRMSDSLGMETDAAVAPPTDDVCVICLNSIVESSVLLPCRHNFHEECLEQYVSRVRNARCPVCRGALPSSLRMRLPQVASVSSSVRRERREGYVQLVIEVDGVEAFDRKRKVVLEGWTTAFDFSANSQVRVQVGL